MSAPLNIYIYEENFSEPISVFSLFLVKINHTTKGYRKFLIIMFFGCVSSRYFIRLPSNTKRLEQTSSNMATWYQLRRKSDQKIKNHVQVRFNLGSGLLLDIGY